MRDGRTEPGNLAWLKRQVRRMKQQELAIRFSTGEYDGRGLVWDQFFGGTLGRPAVYALDWLAGITRARFDEVVDEFFFQVYYVYYRENGLLPASTYDPALLADLGLPPDAGRTAIRRRFRELAKQYHPDVGGDSHQFVRLLQLYRNLMETDDRDFPN